MENNKLIINEPTVGYGLTPYEIGPGYEDKETLISTHEHYSTVLYTPNNHIQVINKSAYKKGLRLHGFAHGAEHVADPIDSAKEIKSKITNSSFYMPTQDSEMFNVVTDLAKHLTFAQRDWHKDSEIEGGQQKASSAVLVRIWDANGRHFVSSVNVGIGMACIVYRETGNIQPLFVEESTNDNKPLDYLGKSPGFAPTTNNTFEVSKGDSVVLLSNSLVPNHDDDFTLEQIITDAITSTSNMEDFGRYLIEKRGKKNRDSLVTAVKV